MPVINGLFDNYFEAASVLYPFYYKHLPQSVNDFLLYLPLVAWITKKLFNGIIIAKQDEVVDEDTLQDISELLEDEDEEAFFE